MTCIQSVLSCTDKLHLLNIKHTPNASIIFRLDVSLKDFSRANGLARRVLAASAGLERAPLRSRRWQIDVIGTDAERAEAVERQSGSSIPSAKEHLTNLPPPARCFLTQHPPKNNGRDSSESTDQSGSLWTQRNGLDQALDNVYVAIIPLRSGLVVTVRLAELAGLAVYWMQPNRCWLSSPAQQYTCKSCFTWALLC